MPKITGVSATIRKLEALPDKAVRGVSQALFAGGEKVKAYAARSITEGAVSGRNHIPSKPGESPNEDTGHLRSQIEVTQPGPLVVEVASNARYSSALEFGSSKMLARPFMGPAVRAKKAEVVAMVNAAVDRAIKDVK